MGLRAMEHHQTHDTTESASESDLTCPQCDAGPVTTITYRDAFDYGLGKDAVTLHVTIPVRYCGACDFEYLDDEADLIRHEAVCTHLGVLTPTEIRSIREHHRMSRAEFAQVSGFGEATLNRWENGAIIQNRANDNFLRLLADPNILHRVKTPRAVEPSAEHRPSGSRRGQVLEFDDPSLRERHRPDAFDLRPQVH